MYLGAGTGGQMFKAWIPTDRKITYVQPKITFSDKVLPFAKNLPNTGPVEVKQVTTNWERGAAPKAIVSSHPRVLSTIMATKPMMKQGMPSPYFEPQAFPYMSAESALPEPSIFEEDDNSFGEIPQSSTPLLIILGVGLLGLMLS